MFPQIFGKYVLEREIASGGMATVLLATLRGAVGFEKRLVVKQIRPELASDEAFVRRFIEEAKMTVDLSHPNIVPVYELGVEQGVYYIAMELCEGVTLAEILTETGPLGPSEGAYVGIEICRALDYAHRRAGIVHRDVTPRNVMIDDEGAVRLIDFGIAAPAMLAGTRQESFGSPGHMPPEQIRGGTLTPASDVFAVGALLIEAWTGKPPFRRRTPDECLRALEQPVPSLADTEPRLLPLAELIGDSVALAPEVRPESAEVLSRPLRDFVKSSDLGDLARKLGARVREVRKRGRSSRPFLVGEGQDDATGKTPPAGETPTSDHGGTDVTQTFAAREEIVEWTRKLPSMPPPKLDAESETEPDPDETAPTTASQRERKDPARAKYVWGLLAVGLSGVALAGILSARGESSRAPAVSAPPTMEVTVAPTPTPTPSIAPSPVVESTTPAAPASSMPVQAPALPPPKPTPTPLAPAHPSATAPSGRALVNLTSSHPATVSVGGRPRGPTPVMGLELPVGSHHVVFTNPVLDERVTTSVTVAAGQTRKVHADFGSATPRVHIY